MSDQSALDAQTASALFANMVIQQTNMALIFLGRTPNPQTGEMIEDLDTAKMLIDQLEMLAVKTRGNLDARETALMNQSLTAIRMAFVEAVEKGPKISPKAGETAKAEASQPQPHAAQLPRPGLTARSLEKGPVYRPFFFCSEPYGAGCVRFCKRRTAWPAMAHFTASSGRWASL